MVINIEALTRDTITAVFPTATVKYEQASALTDMLCVKVPDGGFQVVVTRALSRPQAREVQHNRDMAEYIVTSILRDIVLHIARRAMDEHAAKERT